MIEKEMVTIRLTHQNDNLNAVTSTDVDENFGTDDVIMAFEISLKFTISHGFGSTGWINIGTSPAAEIIGGQIQHGLDFGGDSIMTISILIETNQTVEVEKGFTLWSPKTALHDKVDLITKIAQTFVTSII